jgi:hypothetical protein
MFLLALLLLLRTTTLLAQQQQQPPGEPAAGGKRMIYVATTGSDTSPGTQAQPLATMAGAAKAIVATLSGGLPAGGIEVRVAAGVYEVNASTSLRLGHHFFGVNISGTAASPIVLRGERSADGMTLATVLDGSMALDSTALAPVTNVTKLLSMKVSPAAAALLAGSASLQWGSSALTASRYPDVGLAYVGEVNDRGAVYAQGRTKGPPPHSSISQPIGANITLFGDATGTQPTGDWAAELAAGFDGGRIQGYFFADWYRQTQSIARAELVGGNMTLKLQQYSRYGYCEQMKQPPPQPCAGSAPGRFVASGLLSEVTQPGEYHYDKGSQTVFIFPPIGASKSENLGIWAGPAAIQLEGTSFVTVRDFEIRGVAQHQAEAAVVIMGGDHNTVGGCTIHSSTRAGVALSGGRSNRFVGNDVYDVGVHVSSGGETESNAQSLEATNNLIANNHFTQKVRRDFYGGIRLRGLGDRLSHNLAHDASGQYLTPDGPLTIIDSNEIFNTGYSEGDGGVMYNGMQLWVGQFG